MFTFVFESGFDDELQELEPDPMQADDLLCHIEDQCQKCIRESAKGYGLIRLHWKSHSLFAWYLTSGQTITLIAIQLDIALVA